MSPTMHSPLSSSEDEVISMNADEAVVDVNDEEPNRTVKAGSRDGRHRRHRHKEKKHHRKHKHKHSSQEHRKRHSEKLETHYDFDPKPRMLGSKPLVQYDDVSDNEDNMDVPSDNDQRIVRNFYFSLH